MMVSYSGFRTWLTMLSILLLIIMLVSSSIGAVNIPLMNLFTQSFSSSEAMIFFEIRLPRVCIAAVIGSLLAVLGALSQGLFRNPLADPSLIGVSAGASLGGSLAIVFMYRFDSVLFLHFSVVAIGAFLCGILAVLLVYRFAKNGMGVSVPTMLLVGIAISAFVASCTSLLGYFSSAEQLRQISLWHMGGMAHINWFDVGVAMMVLVIVLLSLRKLMQPLNALLLGESQARYLGIDVAFYTRWIIVLVALGVSVSVALVGPIAFIGLVVPHFVRLLFGANHQRVLPLSVVLGAMLLVITDTFARTGLAPVEIPTGIVTSLIGAPVFIYLLVNHKKRLPL